MNDNIKFITKTTVKNATKYLDSLNIDIPNTKNDYQLVEFAKIIRNKEKIALMKEERTCNDEIRKIEIQTLLKTELWDLKFFLSEGIQEVDYSKWEYADTEIIFNGVNYFEYFTDFIDIINGRIIIHLKNKISKQITKNELMEIFDFLELSIIDSEKSLITKKAVKVFLIDCVFKEQKCQRIIVPGENNIFEFIEDLKNKNFICNNEQYNNEKGLSGYFLYLDYVSFCISKQYKPELKKIFIKELRKKYRYINKSKRIYSQIIKDTVFYVF